MKRGGNQHAVDENGEVSIQAVSKLELQYYCRFFIIPEGMYCDSMHSWKRGLGCLKFAVSLSHASKNPRRIVTILWDYCHNFKGILTWDFSTRRGWNRLKPAKGTTLCYNNRWGGHQ